ncbi:MAG: hypothetical protein O9972_07435 [Burkholderiales bacterium]|nr:hypothetical protein [Burkholderiales bacterium]
MAGETDGKPRDPSDKDAATPSAPAEVVSGGPGPDDAGRPAGRRARGGARREPTTIDLEAGQVAESASVVEATAPVEPAVAAASEMTPYAEAGAASQTGPIAEASAVPTPASEPAPEAARLDDPGPAAPPETEPERNAFAASPAPLPVDPSPPDHVPPVPPPPARRPGIGAPLAVGLAGGVIGAGLVALLMSLIGPGADTPDRLSALETAVGDRATRRTVEALEKRAQASEAALQGLRGDLSGLAGRPQVAPGDVTMLGQRVDRLDRAIAQLAARPAPSGDAQAQAPVQLPPVVVAGRESAALAVAMLIRDAVSRGAPFARELAALQAGGADPALAARLKPFAESGAPQAAALAATFAPLAAALARSPDPGASAGVVDRVTALIGGAVRIRPVGEPAGEKPGAIGARAETALKRGDLAAALKDLDTLPAESRASVQPFVDRLRARVAAGQAADSLVAAAVEQVIAATASSGVPTR